MHERDILDGIETILAEKGKFSPELDHETIRNGNRKLQRVKENVFRKQVKEVWGKHGPRLMAQIRAAKASADVGANMNGILQNQYRGTPKSSTKMTNGTPVSLDRKRKDKSDDDDFEDQAPISKLRRFRKDKIDRFSAEIPEETFSCVGGLSEAKETILRQMMHLHEPRIYSTLGVRPPSGILVHGAPGAGKTLLCKSSAGEIGVNMISVSTPELVSGVSGGSEKNIRQGGYFGKKFGRFQPNYDPIQIFRDFGGRTPIRNSRTPRFSENPRFSEFPDQPIFPI